MDEQVKKAIDEHPDYQRLKGVFPLDFLVECFTKPGRNGTAIWVGNLLRNHRENPTLFVSGIHYHELVELEEFRRIGYTDEQLGENKANDPNYPSLDTIAKIKEFQFYQHVADTVDGVRPPFLAWAFSHLAVTSDFGRRAPPFDVFYRMIEERGFEFYDETFTLQDVEKCIAILKRGGNTCSGERTVLAYATEYLSGKKLAPKVEPWMLL